MKPRIGALVCVKHGGNHPGHKRKAKERLLELVDPALAELHRVLTDKHADDAVKVRAALGILDRTGHGPGAKIEVGISKWEQMFEDGVVTLDRSLPPSEPDALGPAGGDDLGWEDAHQHGEDARAEAWSEYDHEDAKTYERGRIRPDENTVRGEVVVGRYDVPPDAEPTDPPRYWDEEARRADRKPT
jgi:hypothetical protein